jgi:hypothetical protein
MRASISFGAGHADYTRTVANWAAPRVSVRFVSDRRDRQKHAQKTPKTSHFCAVFPNLPVQTAQSAQINQFIHQKSVYMYQYFSSK